MGFADAFGLNTLVGQLLAKRQAQQTPQPAAQGPGGLIAPGNIDLHHRPVVHNKDGSISTVRSITVTGDGGRATVLPTVSPDGRILSNKDAIKLYQKTGQHLGIFQNEDLANRYAQTLHEDQAEEYLPKQVAAVRAMGIPRPAPTLVNGPARPSMM
jgi:hypothetical protein